MLPDDSLPTVSQTREERPTKQPSTGIFFDVEKCKTCVLRDGCYNAGAKSKTYTITIKTDTQAEQVVFKETEEFKELH